MNAYNSVWDKMRLKKEVHMVVVVECKDSFVIETEEKWMIG